MNGANYSPPPLPILLQIASGVTNPSSILPKGSVYGVKRGDIVELRIFATNISTIEPHPFHLHGVCHILEAEAAGRPVLLTVVSQHTFSVIQAAGSSPNYINPPRRDTVSLGSDPNAFAVIRFVVRAFS